MGELDLKALAIFWSIREVHVPQISKVATAGALPHKQPNGMKTADAFLKMFAMELDCWLCLISDIEVYLSGSLMAAQLRQLLAGDLDDGQHRRGCVFCVKREYNFLSQKKR